MPMTIQDDLYPETIQLLLAIYGRLSFAQKDDINHHEFVRVQVMIEDFMAKASDLNALPL